MHIDMHEGAEHIGGHYSSGFVDEPTHSREHLASTSFHTYLTGHRDKDEAMDKVGKTKFRQRAKLESRYSCEG